MTPSPQPPHAPGVANVADLDLGDLPDRPKPVRTRSAPCTHCGPIVSRWPMEEID